MNICGLQKMTLLDFPGRLACTVFTKGCNFRCPFCHNGGLVREEAKLPLLPEEEVMGFLEKRRRVLEGVCVTGGEPLLQPDLESFIRNIKDMGYLVKLDTNGSMPDRLAHLLREGLVDYVAMDLKNTPERYARTIGREQYDTDSISQSIRILMKGHTPYEFRTTVVRELHREEDFEAMGKWIQGAPQYYLQQFEDSGSLLCKGLHGWDRPAMERALERVKKYVKYAALRGI